MNADGSGVPPFAISDGVVKIVNARIAGANIDNLLVDGNQIEPGAVSIVKNLPISGTSSGTYDLVVNHGPNLSDAHHEIRVDLIFACDVGGSTSASYSLNVTELASSSVIISRAGQVRGPNSPSGYAAAADSIWAIFSIPAAQATTTFRVTFSGGVTWGRRAVWSAPHFTGQVG